ncbi:MAG: VOC family protein [Actinobacteria bacterium]|nr:VOC family protein [Actinomycetota bacterium]
MLISRTTGSASVVPELVYPDVGAAVDWLCAAFGFTELWRAGDHRARVAFGNGAVIIADADAQYGRAAPAGPQLHSHAVMVKVDDVDAHCDRARRHGARVMSPPADYSYGERQYTAEDLAGHRWTFTQAIADLAPEDWGGTSKQPTSPSSATR